MYVYTFYWVISRTSIAEAFLWQDIRVIVLLKKKEKKNPPNQKLVKSVKRFNKFSYHHLQKQSVQDLGQWVITSSPPHSHVQYQAICLAIITCSKLNMKRTWSDNIKPDMFPFLPLNYKLSYKFWLQIPSFFIHLFPPIPTSNLVLQSCHSEFFLMFC